MRSDQTPAPSERIGARSTRRSPRVVPRASSPYRRRRRASTPVVPCGSGSVPRRRRRRRLHDAHDMRSGFLCRTEGAIGIARRRARQHGQNERALAVGRKAWLFVGSDDHASSAAGLLSLIASARLHRLDPEEYLRDVFRVLPHWPKDRHLELAPKHWLATRARLAARELAAELGPLTVPPPPEQQPAAD